MRYDDCPGPLAVAHRGGAGLGPENTFEAFRRSHALGVRYLETDVRVTADGQVVAFHDASLDRATGASGRVREHTLDALSSVAVTGGGTVPGLADLFAAFPDSCFTIDVKEPAVIAPLARLLAADGVAERVCLAAARSGWLRRLVELTDARVTTALSWRALAQFASPRAGLGARRTTGSDALLGGASSGAGARLAGAARFAHVPLRLGRIPVFRNDLVSRAHDAGLRVIVWTVNDPSVMHRLLDGAVDGIITDRPDLLREGLVSRGQWHTPDSYGAVTRI